VQPTEKQVREEMTDILARTGMSMRQLSLSMGRDAGYVSALLEEDRHPRATPTPADLERLSDQTGIPLAHLLERFWGVSLLRLASDLSQLAIRVAEDERLSKLTDAESSEVLDFAGYLISRRDGADT
jgi:transcriptional regulator with XRE-family HTH domain